jgi:hypothetical protein
MMYVVFKSRPGTPHERVVLEITQKMETFKQAYIEFYDHEIVQLFADGIDYAELRVRFDNLPIYMGGHCTWFGDQAKFIFFNLANFR